MKNDPQYLAKRQVMEKLRSFHNYVRKNDGQIGTKQRGIELNFNNACNFKCEHCFTDSPKRDHVKEELPIDVIADIANQADELGIFEFDLQGGELLLRPEKLFKVLEAIRPDRFYLYYTTNGYLFDEVIAEKLAKAGVNRLSVSIDSLVDKVHDEFRGKPGALKRAKKALENAKNAGMSPYLNITVGHYNALSDGIADLCQYSEDHGYTTLLNVAVPSGMWQKSTEIMCDDKDRARLIELRKKHKNIFRNIWNPFDRNYEKILGCNTINRIYITPIGDVLVCPYIHIKIGNVYEQSLKEIVDYGFSIKYFRNHSDLCLAGEDKEFVRKYMFREGQTTFSPSNAKDIFTDEDFV